MSTINTRPRYRGLDTTSVFLFLAFVSFALGVKGASAVNVTCDAVSTSVSGTLLDGCNNDVRLRAWTRETTFDASGAQVIGNSLRFTADITDGTCAIGCGGSSLTYPIAAGEEASVPVRVSMSPPVYAFRPVYTGLVPEHVDTMRLISISVTSQDLARAIDERATLSSGSGGRRRLLVRGKSGRHDDDDRVTRGTFMDHVTTFFDDELARQLADAHPHSGDSRSLGESAAAGVSPPLSPRGRRAHLERMSRHAMARAIDVLASSSLPRKHSNDVSHELANPLSIVHHMVGVALQEIKAYASAVAKQTDGADGKGPVKAPRVPEVIRALGDIPSPSEALVNEHLDEGMRAELASLVEGAEWKRGVIHDDTLFAVSRLAEAARDEAEVMAADGSRRLSSQRFMSDEVLGLATTDVTGGRRRANPLAVLAFAGLALGVMDAQRGISELKTKTNQMQGEIDSLGDTMAAEIRRTNSLQNEVRVMDEMLAVQAEQIETVDERAKLAYAAAKQQSVALDDAMKLNRQIQTRTQSSLNAMQEALVSQAEAAGARFSAVRDDISAVASAAEGALRELASHTNLQFGQVYGHLANNTDLSNRNFKAIDLKVSRLEMATDNIQSAMDEIATGKLITQEITKSYYPGISGVIAGGARAFLRAPFLRPENMPATDHEFITGAPRTAVHMDTLHILDVRRTLPTGSSVYSDTVFRLHQHDVVFNCTHDSVRSMNAKRGTFPVILARMSQDETCALPFSGSHDDFKQTYINSTSAVNALYETAFGEGITMCMCWAQVRTRSCDVDLVGQIDATGDYRVVTGTGVPGDISNAATYVSQKGIDGYGGRYAPCRGAPITTHPTSTIKTVEDLSSFFDGMCSDPDVPDVRTMNPNHVTPGVDSTAVGAAVTQTKLSSVYMWSERMAAVTSPVDPRYVPLSRTDFAGGSCPVVLSGGLEDDSAAVAPPDVARLLLKASTGQTLIHVEEVSTARWGAWFGDSRSFRYTPYEHDPVSNVRFSSYTMTINFLRGGYLPVYGMTYVGKESIGRAASPPIAATETTAAVPSFFASTTELLFTDPNAALLPFNRLFLGHTECLRKVCPPPATGVFAEGTPAFLQIFDHPDLIKGVEDPVPRQGHIDYMLFDRGGTVPTGTTTREYAATKAATPEIFEADNGEGVYDANEVTGAQYYLRALDPSTGKCQVEYTGVMGPWCNLLEHYRVISQSNRDEFAWLSETALAPCLSDASDDMEYMCFVPREVHAEWQGMRVLAGDVALVTGSFCPSVFTGSLGSGRFEVQNTDTRSTEYAYRVVFNGLDPDLDASAPDNTTAEDWQFILETSCVNTTLQGPFTLSAGSSRTHDFTSLCHRHSIEISRKVGTSWTVCRSADALIDTRKTVLTAGEYNLLTETRVLAKVDTSNIVTNNNLGFLDLLVAISSPNSTVPLNFSVVPPSDGVNDAEFIKAATEDKLKTITENNRKSAELLDDIDTVMENNRKWIEAADAQQAQLDQKMENATARIDELREVLEQQQNQTDILKEEVEAKLAAFLALQEENRNNQPSESIGLFNIPSFGFRFDLVVLLLIAIVIYVVVKVLWAKLGPQDRNNFSRVSLAN